MQIPFPGELIAGVVEELKTYPEWRESYGKEAHGEEGLYQLIYGRVIQNHSEEVAQVMGVRSVLTYRLLYHNDVSPLDDTLRTITTDKLKAAP